MTKKIWSDMVCLSRFTHLLADLTRSEVKCFQSKRCSLVLPAWNSALRLIDCVLRIHTSSCGISSLLNDMASNWHCFCCCWSLLLWWLVVILTTFITIVRKRFISSLAWVCYLWSLFCTLFCSVLVNADHL